MSLPNYTLYVYRRHTLYILFSTNIYFSCLSSRGVDKKALFSGVFCLKLKCLIQKKNELLPQASESNGKELYCIYIYIYTLWTRQNSQQRYMSVD